MGSDFWPHLFNSSYNVGINLKKEELLTMSVNSFCACMKIRLFFLRRREISRKHHQTALTNAVCQQTATNYHPPLPFCASKTRFKHREEFPVGLSKSPDETRLRDEISPARSVTNTWGKWKKKKKKGKKKNGGLKSFSGIEFHREQVAAWDRNSFKGNGFRDFLRVSLRRWNSPREFFCYNLMHYRPFPLYKFKSGKFIKPRVLRREWGTAIVRSAIFSIKTKSRGNSLCFWNSEILY